MSKTYALLIDDFIMDIFDTEDKLKKLNDIRHIFEICGHDLIIISKVDGCYNWYYYDINTWKEIARSKRNISAISPFIDDVIIGSINYKVIDMERDAWYADIEQLVVDKQNRYKSKEYRITREDYNFINVKKLCMNNSGAIIRRSDDEILIDHMILTDNVNGNILGAFIKDIIYEVDVRDQLIRGNRDYNDMQIDSTMAKNHQPIVLITDDQFSDNEFMSLFGFYIRKTPRINYMIGVIRWSSFIQQDVMIELIGVNSMNQWDFTGDNIHVKLYTSGGFHMLYLLDESFLDELIARGIRVTGCTSCKLYDFIENHEKRNEY